MPHHYEANEVPYQTTLDTLSPDRPPQLNKTVSSCGCRCGCGRLGKGGDGGTNDEDNTPTLIGTDFADEAEPHSSDGPEGHVHVGMFQAQVAQTVRLTDEVPTKFVVFENGREGFQLQLAPHVAAMEDMPFRAHRVQQLDAENTDMTDNEPRSSNDDSMVPSDNRTVRCISPGPGIGMWASEELKDSHFNEYYFSEYHFHVRPLRLTPQRRYCRGLVSSHMVMPDEGFCRRCG